jgi:lipid A 4'-phosphatase
MGLQLSHPLLAYLSRARTRAILGCFLAISLLLVEYPGLDLGVSRIFFDGGFYMADDGWTRLLHASVPWFVAGSLGAVVVAYVFNRLTGRRFCGIDGRKVVYLFLVIAFGAGLVVNVMLKESFGRARPRDIAEFGGEGHFTPAYVISSNCTHNCSFSSGDGAGAFCSLAFVVGFTRRRAIATSAAGYGVLVSAARIAAGAHYLSDTVVSFFVMLIVSDALHYRLFLFSRESAPVPIPARLPAPALVSVPGKTQVRR